MGLFPKVVNSDHPSELEGPQRQFFFSFHLLEKKSQRKIVCLLLKERPNTRLLVQIPLKLS